MTTIQLSPHFYLYHHPQLLQQLWLINNINIITDIKTVLKQTLLKQCQFIPRVSDHNNWEEYSWQDDLGFHQYYAYLIISTLVHTIHDFQREMEDQDRCCYSWHDNLGFHKQYYDNMDTLLPLF